jgi:hypothetical protein
MNITQLIALVQAVVPIAPTMFAAALAAKQRPAYLASAFGVPFFRIGADQLCTSSENVLRRWSRNARVLAGKCFRVGTAA